jgi:hypothetical protein
VAADQDALEAFMARATGGKNFEYLAPVLPWDDEWEDPDRGSESTGDPSETDAYKGDRRDMPAQDGDYYKDPVAFADNRLTARAVGLVGEARRMVLADVEDKLARVDMAADPGEALDLLALRDRLRQPTAKEAREALRKAIDFTRALDRRESEGRRRGAVGREHLLSQTELGRSILRSRG